MTITQTLNTSATSVERGLIHDLRNLFGVVASAKHMLEDGPAGPRRDSLLAAIEDAAWRGGQLTTKLLAAAEAEAPTMFDIGNRILMMAPMIRAMAGHHADVRFDLDKARAVVKLVPAWFEAAILELVSNASASLHLPGHILVGLRVQGKRVRITITDDGCGMDKARAEHALEHHHNAGARGTGLRRVRHFARSGHGSMRLRSRAGHGTIVTLTLPLVLPSTPDKPAVPIGRSSSPCRQGH